MEYVKIEGQFPKFSHCAVTLGKFDGIHRGHRKLIQTILNRKKEYGELAVVMAFVSDRQTILTSEERHILLEKMGVDILLECPLNDQIKHMKADVFIRQILKGDLQASCVVVGEDFRFGHERKGSPELLEKYGEKYDYETIVIAKEMEGNRKISSTYIREELKKRGTDIPFDVASNPEFLKEGDAIRDFLSPDRVVVGVENDRARKLMETLYRPFLLKNFRVIFMDIPSAEMTKYAANSMLATRISFINEMANLCECVGADVNMVRAGIGSDSRIGNKFLYPGCGYGGSCFPKDVKAIINTGLQHGYRMKVMEAVDEMNERQKEVLFHKPSSFFEGQLEGKTIGIWGLSYKPQTDDMREAPSLVLIDKLLKAGCKVQAYDPVAMDECRRRLGDRITYAKDLYQAAANAHALVLVTEWKEFRMPGWEILKKVMKQPVVLDGRNIYLAEDMAANGFHYLCIGR